MSCCQESTHETHHDASHACTPTPAQEKAATGCGCDTASETKTKDGCCDETPAEAATATAGCG